MLSAIVLAAGQSRRMGQPKALLDWGGQPLAAYQVKQLREAGCDEVIVVLGAKSDEIHRQLGHLECRVMFNQLHQAGRAGSLRVGARAVSADASAILIANVDQPRPASFLRELIAAHTSEAAVTVPVHGGRRGHPVIVAGRLRDELLVASDEEEGLRAILERHADATARVATDDLCEVDVNTPDDYAAAKERFQLNVAP